MADSSSPDNITSSSSGSGGSIAVGIVLGILAGIFILLVVLSRFLCRGAHREGSPEDLEAGKRKRLASILKLDGVAPSQAYRKSQDDPKSELPSSCSFDEITVCVICLEILQDTDMVRHLPCQHYFHSSCLDTWYLRQHNNCPLCKTPFFKETPKKGSKEAEPSVRAVDSRSG